MEQKARERGDLTRAALMALLGRNGPMSRAAIARGLDMSAANVGQLARKLIDAGLLEELEHEPSTGGRPGQRLGLVGSAARAVGVKVALDRLTTVDMHLDGTVAAARVDPFEASTPDALARLGLHLQSFAEEREIPLLGVGVGASGVIDAPDIGNVTSAAFGWCEAPVGRHLRGVLGIPVLVEDSVKALASAERLYGLGRAHRTFAVVTIGPGVGFAAVLDGVVFRGSRGGAGEIAHLPVNATGARCFCGRDDCLRAVAGEDGLLHTARRTGILSGGEGLDVLAARADHCDAARAVYAPAARELARLVAVAVAAIDPEVLLVAGEGVVAWRHWEQPFSETLRERLPAAFDLPVRVTSWDDMRWARGAAAIVLATPFDGASGRLGREVLARLQRERHNEAIGAGRR